MMLKRLITLIEPRRKRQLLGLLPIMFFGSLLEMLGISLVVSVCTLLVDTDRMANNVVIAWLYRWTSLQPGSGLTTALFFFLIFLYLFKMVYLLAENYVLARFSWSFRHELSTKLFSGLLHGPYEYFTRTSTAEVINLLHSGVQQTANYFSALLQTVTEAFVMLSVSVFLIVVNPVMTLFVLLGAVASFFLTRVFIRRKALRAGKTQRTANAARMKWLNQGIHGIKEVKTWRTENFFCDRYSYSDWEFARVETLSQLLSTAPRICIEGIMVLFVLIYIIFLLSKGVDILLFLPSLSALVLSALRLMPACNRINSKLTQMNYNKPAVESVCDALEHIKRKDAQNDHREEITLSRAITAKGITFSYEGRPEPVLKDVDIEIPIGAFVGIVGPSGVGKTTLIDILLGLLEPQRGTICADGQDILNCRESYLDKIAYLPQTIFLLDDSIRSNVAFGVSEKRVSDAAIWDALERASLADMVQSLPEGLDTLVGEGGVRLSGGERQRLGIARALYRNCPVLIFDESTSALDTDTEADVLDSIYAQKGEKTVVIVSHRKSVIDGCDRIYRVDDHSVKREK